MKKISVTLNLSKIDKSRIVERTYKGKDGKDVTEKQYKIEIIELKEPRFVTEGDTWRMMKTHFVIERRGRDEEDNFVGDGYSFEDKKDALKEPTLDDISDIPF